VGIIEAVVLGAVQGVTEFLPVSSSGHLALACQFLGVEEPALFFSIVLHVGTLGAVVAVLWKEVFALLKKPFQKTTLLLVVATLPVVAVALVCKDLIDRKSVV
jgi:undecaprenyl-diphosphatase